MISKEKVINSIVTAENELKKVLEEIERLPSFDITNVSLSAHALRNYLTVINFTIDMLKMQLKDNKELTVWLENLQRTSDLMRETVNKLTQASYANKVKLCNDKINITNGIKNTTNYYQKVAAQKNIEIICECDTKRSYIYTDRVAISVILDNLLSNAIKYSNHGRKIWIKVKDDDSNLIVSIKDEGPGIECDKQANLFKKGVTLGHIPTGGEPSTGFGLAIAKELVEKLGGKIWCESEHGKGTCFFFSLPIKPE